MSATKKSSSTRPARLHYTHRFASKSEKTNTPRAAPGPSRVHRIELEFDAPVAHAEVYEIAKRHYQTLHDFWVFDGSEWWYLWPSSKRPDAKARKLVLCEPFHEELISAEREKQHEDERRAHEQWALENDEAELGPFFGAEARLAALRHALPPHQIHTFGSRAALQQEIDRLREFFALEWWGDGFFHLSLGLTKRPGSTKKEGRDSIRETLLALGYRDAGKDGLIFDHPMGIWEGSIRAACGEEGCRLHVVLSEEVGPAARDIVDILMQSAERLEQTLDLVASDNPMTGDAALATIKERVARSLDVLEQDGLLGGGQRWPDINTDALEALAKEKLAVSTMPVASDAINDAPDVLRAAGRTLTFSEDTPNPRVAHLATCAVVAAVGVAVALWTSATVGVVLATVGVVVFVSLALMTPRAKRRDFELGLEELTITSGGHVERFKLPLAGQPVPPLPANSWLAGVFKQGVFMRNGLAGRSIPAANRVALETIFWATASADWSERRAGSVAAAIGNAGGLAFFEDQESLDDWASKETQPHRLAFLECTAGDIAHGLSPSSIVESSPQWLEWERVALNPRSRVLKDEEPGDEDT